MIDKTLLVSPDMALWFHVKQTFWLYLFPLVMGFVGVLCMQIYMRVGQMGGVKAWTAFLFAGCSAMINLWGWAHITRTPALIPFYGCGVGLAAAVMSRIFAITKDPWTRWKVPVPRVIWKGNAAGIQALMERMKLAAQQSVTTP